MSKNIKKFRRDLNRPFTHEELDNSMMVLNEWEFDFEYQTGNYVLFDTSSYPALITNGGLNLYKCIFNHKSSEIDYPTSNNNWSLIGNSGSGNGSSGNGSTNSNLTGDGYKIAQWNDVSNNIEFSYYSNDKNGVPSANFDDRRLFCKKTEVLNWGDCRLIDTNDSLSMNWHDRLLYGNESVTIDYANCKLYDTYGSKSMNWHERSLINMKGDIIFTWSDIPRCENLTINDMQNAATMNHNGGKLHLYDTTIHWEMLNAITPPSNIKNIVDWVDVYKNGQLFKMPLYQ
jgi:hypothetical protein